MVLPVELVERRAAQARLLRGLAAGSQVVVMVALFVLWKQMAVPFWRAVEWCFVAGVSAYTFLAMAAAALMTLARLQPVALLLAHVSRAASVVIYALLRWVHGFGPFKSLATWAVLYVVAALLVRRIERGARRRLQI